jgi:hypothetical protein
MTDRPELFGKQPLSFSMAFPTVSFSDFRLGTRTIGVGKCTTMQFNAYFLQLIKGMERFRIVPVIGQRNSEVVEAA